MKNFPNICDFDSALITVEVDAEKAKYMAYRVYNELAEDRTDAAKLYYYNNLRIMSEIVHDYACQVQEELKKVRELFDDLWKDAKKAEGKLEAQEAAQHEG